MLELAPQSVLQAALIVYGIPLAAVALVGALATLLGWSDGRTVLVMMGAVIIAVAIGRKRLRRSNCLNQFTPTIGGHVGTVR